MDIMNSCTQLAIFTHYNCYVVITEDKISLPLGSQEVPVPNFYRVILCKAKFWVHSISCLYLNLWNPWQIEQERLVKNCIHKQRISEGKPVLPQSAVKKCFQSLHSINNMVSSTSRQRILQQSSESHTISRISWRTQVIERFALSVNQILYT